jgi:hypothetical protein
MAARHGICRRYVEGCRCEDCTGANRVYFRQRRAAKVQPPAAVVSLPAAGASQPYEPGPVESGVAAEISDLAAEARPGLTQTALALARILDDPRATSQKPAAARVLTTLLEKLRSASARVRRGGLTLVRTMTEKGGA